MVLITHKSATKLHNDLKYIEDHFPIIWLKNSSVLWNSILKLLNYYYFYYGFLWWYLSWIGTVTVIGIRSLNSSDTYTPDPATPYRLLFTVYYTYIPTISAFEKWMLSEKTWQSAGATVTFVPVNGVQTKFKTFVRSLEEQDDGIQ